MLQGVCNLNGSIFSISLPFLGSCICLRKSQYKLSSTRYFCPCLNCCIGLHDNRGYMIIALLKYKYVLFYVLICADNYFLILVFCLHLHCLLLPSSASSCSLHLGLHIKKNLVISLLNFLCFAYLF